MGIYQPLQRFHQSHLKIKSKNFDVQYLYHLAKRVRHSRTVRTIECIPEFRHRNCIIQNTVVFQQQYRCFHQSKNSTTEVEENTKGI